MVSLNDGLPVQQGAQNGDGERPASPLGQVEHPRCRARLRKIDNGTYKRHVFKANLHERERALKEDAPPEPSTAEENAAEEKATTKGEGESAELEIFNRYIEAAKSCGQSIAGLTPAKLQKVMDKQAGAIKKKLGVKNVKFRVEVVEGKVKLKARALKAS